MEAEEKKPRNRKRRRRCAGKGKTKKCRKGGEGRGENRLSSLSLSLNLSLSFTYFPPFLFFYGGGETTTATRDLTIFRRCSLVDRERNFLLTYIYPAHPSVYSLQIVSARKRWETKPLTKTLSLFETHVDKTPHEGKVKMTVFTHTQKKKENETENEKNPKENFIQRLSSDPA